MPGSCAVCGAHGPKVDVAACVGCAASACKACLGDEGGSYWSLKGKKGYACGKCIETGTVFEGGPTAAVRETRAYIQSVIVPRLLAEVDIRMDRARDEMVKPVVADALQRVESLTKRTLVQAEGTSATLVGKIEHAISNQRVEVVSDAREMMRVLRGTVFIAATVVGVINMLAVVLGMWVAKHF